MADVLGEVLRKKRIEINAKLSRGAVLSARFLPQEKVADLWQAGYLRSALPHLTEDEVTKIQENYITSFTIIVFLDRPFTSEELRRAFLGDGKEHLTDKHLPFEKEIIENSAKFRLRDSLREHFREAQYVFTPFMIRRTAKAEIHAMDENQRFPFDDEPKQIATGGYGQVFQVTIAKHCYRDNRKNDMGNMQPQPVAYKSFRRRADYEKEVKNLNYLRESLIDRMAIALHLAAIIKGNTQFYIFFELSPLGDLECLFNGGHEREPDRWDTNAPGEVKYNFRDNFPNPQKTDFVTELISISEALHYLHDELPRHPRENGSTIYCAHMDLRPNNILVYPHDNGEARVGKWVLTDFGISAFRDSEQRSEEAFTISDLVRTSTVSSPHTLIGTQRAPELHHNAPNKREIAGRKCDIWSFSCIAHEVFAFMLGTLGTGDVDVDEAVKSLEDFQTEKKGKKDDYWFDFKMTEVDGREQWQAYLRPSISKWLDQIEATVQARSPTDQGWVRHFVATLNASFRIPPHERPKANDITKMLNVVRTHISKASVQQKRQVSPRPTMRSGDPHSMDTASWANMSVYREQSESPTSRRRLIDGTRANAVRLADHTDHRHEFSPRRHSADPDRQEDRHQNYSPLQSNDDLRPQNQPSLPSATGINDALPNSSRVPSANIGVSRNTAISQVSPVGTVTSLPIKFLKPLPRPSESVSLCPSGDKAAAICKNSKTWEVSIIDLTKYDPAYQSPIDLKREDCLTWRPNEQRPITLSGKYLTIVGAAAGKSQQWLLESGMSRLIQPVWAESAYGFTPSSMGAFAWVEHAQPTQWTVWVLNSHTGVKNDKSFDTNVEHLWFNAKGTYLFVWTRRSSRHFVYTVSVDDPARALEWASFPGLEQRSLTKSFWAANSTNLCVVQEGPTKPRYCIQAKSAEKIEEDEVPDAEKSATAICDNYMATLTPRRPWSFTKINLSLKLRRLQFPPNIQSESDRQPTLISDEIQASRHSHLELAVCEDSDKTVRITAYIWKGKQASVHNFSSPPL